MSSFRDEMVLGLNERYRLEPPAEILTTCARCGAPITQREIDHRESDGTYCAWCLMHVEAENVLQSLYGDDYDRA